MKFTFRPIVQWPKEPTRGRKSSRFQASYPETLALLTRELDHLSARDVVIQLALESRNLRLDGLPRAHARPSHPGVILSFEGRHGPLSFPCDTFADWESNVRAIALALEALRAVDRYGVTQRAEQYRGWAQLPEGFVAVPGEELENAARYIANLHPSLTWNSILKSADAFRTAYREVAREAHPDVGGTHNGFVMLQAAAEKLKQHHGL